MKIAFLYPGQGAQYEGMAKDLYEHNDVFRATFDECSEASGLDLKKVCFEGENLDKGEYVQPAIFAHSISLTQVVKQMGFKPSVFAGLSLGEYAALAAAGIFSPGEGCALVRQRGKLMDEAVEPGKGGMVCVIGLEASRIKAIIKPYNKYVWIANYISDNQTVIGGQNAVLSEILEEFIKAGAKMARPLNVAGPFHTPMLSGAAASFMSHLSTVQFNMTQEAVYSNYFGRMYQSRDDKYDVLARQICSPVHWNDCVRDIMSSKLDLYIELGPGKVIGQELKRNYKEEKDKVFSVQDVESLANLYNTVCRTEVSA